MRALTRSQEGVFLEELPRKVMISSLGSLESSLKILFESGAGARQRVRRAENKRQNFVEKT